MRIYSSWHYNYLFRACARGSYPLHIQRLSNSFKVFSTYYEGFFDVYLTFFTYFLEYPQQLVLLLLQEAGYPAPLMEPAIPPDLPGASRNSGNLFS